MSPLTKRITILILVTLCLIACASILYDPTLPSWTRETTDFYTHTYRWYSSYIVSILLYFFADTWLILYPCIFYFLYCLFTQRAIDKKLLLLPVFLVCYSAAWESWYQKSFLFGATPGGLLGIKICSFLTFFLDKELIPLFFRQIALALFILYLPVLRRIVLFKR